MPTTPSERRPLARAVASATLLLAVAGCSGDEASPLDAAPLGDDPASSVGTPISAPSVARALRKALDRRADAVRRGDSDAFLAGLARGRPGFRRTQQALLANLQELPVTTFDYSLRRGTLVRQDGDYWVEVDLTLELDGFDRVPVVSRDRYRFTAGKGDRFVLASTRDRAWQELHGVAPQPWESGRLTVRSRGGVLGLFDEGSADAADDVMDDLVAGASDVAATVPYDWDRKVVVYALSDPAFLSGLHHTPGDDPLALDAVTFPVPAAPKSSEVAGIRVVLNPRMLQESGPSRGRLFRHELTHVALEGKLGKIPTWFSEGLAEYVSVQPLAPEDRVISGAALDAARAEPRTLPDDETFNGATSQANYGLSWWACEYLAETYDPSILWVALDALSAGQSQDEVLGGLLQTDEATLARKSARLMVNTYDPPEPKKTKKTKKPDPSDDPSEEPGDDPSATTSQESG